MKSKKKSSLHHLFDTYNSKKTKGSIENTLLKTTVDVATSSLVGTGIASMSGQDSILVGIALIGAGHYLGDESGLLRMAGASTIAYGIAKSKEYQNNPKLVTVSKRMEQLKQDLLSTLHIKWKKEKSEKKVKTISKEDKTPKTKVKTKEDA